MKRVTDEQIQAAKQVSILQVAESCGIPIHKVGHSKFSWRSVENSGLVFSEMKNTFFMHSALFGQPQGTGGSTIDFVQMMKGLNFPQAVEELTRGNYEQVEIKPEPKRAPFRDYFESSQDLNQTAVKNYLIHERKLDERIVQKLLDKHYLKEDAYHQAIFYWAKHGVKAGASVQGTRFDSEKYGGRGRFKGIATNSESGFGFNVQLGEKVGQMYVFESPIDALSYWSLHPELQDALLVSVDGVKTRTVYNFMNYLAMNHHFDAPDDLDKFQVFIGSDNDAAGQKFIADLLDTPVVRQQAPEFRHNRLFIAHSPDSLFKDWNEELQFVARLKEQDQFVNFDRRQFAQIERLNDGQYQVKFDGPDEGVQKSLFQVKNRSEVMKLLNEYDFERLSKHDLERLGLDVFDKKTTEQELQPEENLEVGL